MKFQLTPSRRATWRHCPLRYSFYFNSRPHGGRRLLFLPLLRLRYFNSRPHGGRRWLTSFMSSHKSISTHALTEGDVVNPYVFIQETYFNSRPHGGRLPGAFLLPFFKVFQLTPSRRATQMLPSCRHLPWISTHALTEGDSCTFLPLYVVSSFQLTPSRRATVVVLAFTA